MSHVISSIGNAVGSVFPTSGLSQIFGGSSHGGGFLGNVGNILGSALGLGSQAEGSDIQKGINAAVQKGDPLLAYAPYFANQLYQLYTNPGSLSSSPALQWQEKQGALEVQGQAAASGMLNSGNTMGALQTLGQGLATQQYDQTFQQLAALGGGQPQLAGLLASGSTANAVGNQGGINGLLQTLGFGASAAGGGGGILSGLNGILGGIAGLFGGAASVAPEVALV